jgi:hypothetical protein
MTKAGFADNRVPSNDGRLEKAKKAVLEWKAENRGRAIDSGYTNELTHLVRIKYNDLKIFELPLRDRKEFALTVFDKNDFPNVHSAILAIYNALTSKKLPHRLNGQRTVRLIPANVYHVLANKLSLLESRRSLADNRNVRFAIDTLLFDFIRPGEKRITELLWLLEQINTELKHPGKGRLPVIVAMQDLHGGLRRALALVGFALGLDKMAYERIRTLDDLKMALDEAGIDPADLDIRIIGVNDKYDRGEEPVGVYELVRWLRDVGKAKYFTGNHDFWRAMSVLGVHLIPGTDMTKNHGIGFWSKDAMAHAGWGTIELDQVNEKRFNAEVDRINIILKQYGLPLLEHIDLAKYRAGIDKELKAIKKKNAKIRQENEANKDKPGYVRKTEHPLPDIFRQTLAYVREQAALNNAKIANINTEHKLDIKPNAYREVNLDNYRDDPEVISRALWDLQHFRLFYMDILGNLHLHSLLPLDFEHRRMDVEYKELHGISALEQMQEDIRSFFEGMDTIPDSNAFRARMWKVLGPAFTEINRWYSDVDAYAKAVSVKRFADMGGPAGFGSEFIGTSVKQFADRQANFMVVMGHNDRKKFGDPDTLLPWISLSPETGSGLANIDDEMSKEYEDRGSIMTIFKRDEKGAITGIRRWGYPDANIIQRIMLAHAILGNDMNKAARILYRKEYLFKQSALTGIKDLTCLDLEGLNRDQAKMLKRLSNGKEFMRWYRMKILAELEPLLNKAVFEAEALGRSGKEKDLRRLRAQFEKNKKPESASAPAVSAQPPKDMTKAEAGTDSRAPLGETLKGAPGVEIINGGKIFISPQHSAIFEVHSGRGRYRSYIYRIRSAGIEIKNKNILVMPEDKKIAGPWGIISKGGEIPVDKLDNLPMDEKRRHIDVVMAGNFDEGCVSTAFENIAKWQYGRGLSGTYHFIGEMINDGDGRLIYEKMQAHNVEVASKQYDRLKNKQLFSVNIYKDGNLIFTKKGDIGAVNLNLCYWTTADAFTSGTTQSVEVTPTGSSTDSGTTTGTNPKTSLRDTPKDMTKPGLSDSAATQSAETVLGQVVDKYDYTYAGQRYQVNVVCEALSPDDKVEKMRVSRIVIDGKPMRVRPGDMIMLVFHKEKTVVIGTVFPEFPEPSIKGRARAMLAQIFSRPDLAGYEIIAEASDSLQRSWSRMPEEFLPQTATAWTPERSSYPNAAFKIMKDARIRAIDEGIAEKRRSYKEQDYWDSFYMAWHECTLYGSIPMPAKAPKDMTKPEAGTDSKTSLEVPAAPAAAEKAVAGKSKTRSIRQRTREYYDKSIVELEVESETGKVRGTGFIICKDGTIAGILTAGHVVKGARSIRIIWKSREGQVEVADGTIICPILQGPNIAQDLAVLSCSIKNPASKHVIPMHTKRIAAPGLLFRKFWVFTCSGFTTRSAQVNDITGTDGPVWLDCDYEAGMSGSPVIDRYGRLMGIVVGKVDFQGVAMVPYYLIRKYLRESGVMDKKGVITVGSSFGAHRESANQSPAAPGDARGQVEAQPRDTLQANVIPAAKPTSQVGTVGQNADISAVEVCGKLPWRGSEIFPEIADALGLTSNDVVLEVGPGNSPHFAISCAIRKAKVDIVQPDVYFLPQHHALVQNINTWRKAILENEGTDLVGDRIDTESFRTTLEDANLPANKYSVIALFEVLDSVETQDHIGHRKLHSFVNKALESAGTHCSLLISTIPDEDKPLDFYLDEVMNIARTKGFDASPGRIFGKMHEIVLQRRAIIPATSTDMTVPAKDWRIISSVRAILLDHFSRDRVDGLRLDTLLWKEEHVNMETVLSLRGPDNTSIKQMVEEYRLWSKGGPMTNGSLEKSLIFKDAAKYAAMKPETSPSIILIADESGELKVWDGARRILAALLRGDKTISAYIGRHAEKAPAPAQTAGTGPSTDSGTTPSTNPKASLDTRGINDIGTNTPPARPFDSIYKYIRTDFMKLVAKNEPQDPPAGVTVEEFNTLDRRNGLFYRGKKPPAKVIYTDSAEHGRVVLANTGELIMMELERDGRGVIYSPAHGKCLSCDIRAVKGGKTVIGHAHIPASPEDRAGEDGRIAYFYHGLVRRLSDSGYTDIQLVVGAHKKLYGIKGLEALRDERVIRIVGHDEMNAFDSYTTQDASILIDRPFRDDRFYSGPIAKEPLITPWSGASTKEPVPIAIAGSPETRPVASFKVPSIQKLDTPAPASATANSTSQVGAPTETDNTQTAGTGPSTDSGTAPGTNLKTSLDALDALDADIQNAVALKDTLAKFYEEDAQKIVYTIRLDTNRVSTDYIGLIRNYYARILASDKVEVRVLGNDKNKGLVDVSVDIGGKNQGNGTVDLKEGKDKIKSLGRLVGMVNLAMAVASLPDEFIDSGVEKYRVILDMISNQYELLTGDKLVLPANPKDIASFIRALAQSLPKIRSYGVKAQDEFRLMEQKLKSAA